MKFSQVVNVQSMVFVYLSINIVWQASGEGKNSLATLQWTSRPSIDWVIILCSCMQRDLK